MNGIDITVVGNLTRVRFDTRQSNVDDMVRAGTIRPTAKITRPRTS